MWCRTQYKELNLRKSIQIPVDFKEEKVLRANSPVTKGPSTRIQNDVYLIVGTIHSDPHPYTWKISETY